MAATLTAYNAVLKRVYTSDTLVDQLFQKTQLLNMIENKGPKYSIGELARVPLHVSRNGGFTVLADGGGTLNAAGNQGLQKTDYTYSHQQQQIAIQEDVIRQTSDNATAVANVVKTEVGGALTDLRRQIQRQLFMDGSAKIAQCRATSSNDVDLLSTTNAGLLSGLNAINRGWLFVGQTVSVGTAASPTLRAASGTITAIDKTNVAFTHSLGNLATEQTTDFVFNVGSMGGSSVSNEMNGLANLAASSGAFGTLTTATEPTWAAANADSTAQALTVSLMLQQDQAVHQVTGNVPNILVTGLRQERKFYEQLQTQVRFGSDSAISAGSVDTPKWRGMEIVSDPDCPDTDMYFGQKEHVFLVADSKGPFWQNSITGGDTLAWIQGTASYGAKLAYHLNLASDQRNAFARLSGLS